MKDTYLKIYSNAEQLIGLPAMTQLQIDQINQQATQLIFNTQAKGVCCGDCNENAITFQTQPGGDGFACCGQPVFPDEESMNPGATFMYDANGWLFPCDLEANPPQFFPGEVSPFGSKNYYCAQPPENPGGGMEA